MGQIEIEVHAAGLNFSDVLKALGLYPGIIDDIVPLGLECSGVISAVGPGVTRWSVGDEVMAFFNMPIRRDDFAAQAVAAGRALRRALDDADFRSPYGRELSKILRHGVGIHHAGLLPKYRLLVGKLTACGLLKVVRGTNQKSFLSQSLCAF